MSLFQIFLLTTLKSFLNYRYAQLPSILDVQLIVFSNLDIPDDNRRIVTDYLNLDD